MIRIARGVPGIGEGISVGFSVGGKDVGIALVGVLLLGNVHPTRKSSSIRVANFIRIRSSPITFDYF